MKHLIFLLSILIFIGCNQRDTTTTTSTARTVMNDMPDETLYYTFTFKDKKLQKFDIKSTYETTHSTIKYIDKTHIDLIENIIQNDTDSESIVEMTRHFIFDDKGKLKTLTAQENDDSTITVIHTYTYNDKGFISTKSTPDHSADLRYETNEKGQITKEVYLDKSGFNLFIYSGDKVKAINFYDEKNKYIGAMLFKDPIDLDTLLLLE